MNKKYSIFIIIIIAFQGCKNKVIEENAIAFSMSDTMYEQCKFSEVKLDTVYNEIRLFGKITADNNKTAQVFPIMSGVVKKINVELGDYVKQGEVLATIQSSEVAGYQKQLLDAQNDVAIAEKNLQVAKDLFIGKLNSEKDVLAAQKELEKAKAELSRINDIYTIYQLKSGSMFDITAPMSGFIVRKNINQNELLRSDITEPVFSIAEINEVWVMANVTESDISKIQVGYNTEVKTLAFPDITYKGKIDKIFNAIDPETKSMKVRIKIPNTDLKLKPEMNCLINVRYSENLIMTSVPSSSVIFDKNKYWVMIFYDRNNIETRRVDVYKQLGDITYISDGLRPNEKIITQNALLIYDAMND